MSVPGEQRLRATLPVYVGSFNQPTYLSHMVETLLRNGFANVVVSDNASTSPKLLNLLAHYDNRAGVTVRRSEKNVGPHESVRQIISMRSGPFIFTDPDLELAEPLPDTFLTTLFRLSRAYRCRKVGLALEIPAPEKTRDLKFVLPPHGTFTVQEWEKRFWEHEVEPDVFRAGVDTTFFLWNPEIRIDTRRAYRHFRKKIRPRFLARLLPELLHSDLRVAKPGYIARHLPWYVEDGMPEDERAFYRQSTSRASTWLRDSD